MIDAAGGGVAADDVDGGAFLHKGAPRASSSVRYAASPALGSVISDRSFSSPARSIPVNVYNNWDELLRRILHLLRKLLIY